MTKRVMISAPVLLIMAVLVAGTMLNARNEGRAKAPARESARSSLVDGDRREGEEWAHSEQEDGLREAIAIPQTEDDRGDPVGSQPRISGRVVNSEGMALPGVQVRLSPSQSEVSQLGRSEGDDADSELPLERSVSDEEGRFAVEAAPGAEYQLDLRPPKRLDCAPQRLEHCLAGRHYEVVLTSGGKLWGRVSLAEVGPVEVANSAVTVSPIRGWGGEGTLELRAQTNAEGYYELSNVPSGTVSVVARSECCADSAVRIVDIEPRKRVRCDLLLASGVSVRGTVVDETSGAPIAGASVSGGAQFGRSVLTDDQGQYELPNFAVSAPSLQRYAFVYARAPGFGMREVKPRPTAAAFLAADFALSRARAAVGSVVDQYGRGQAESRVMALGLSYNPILGIQQADFIGVRTGADGSFRLDGLRADMAHTLVIEKSGFARAVYAFPDDEFRLAAIDFGSIVLSQPYVVSGRVSDQSHSAVDRLAVSLAGTNEDRFRYGGRPGQSVDVYVSRRHAVTDAEGRFVFAGLAAGEYLLETAGRGWPRIELERFQLGGRNGDVELALEIGRRGAIRGRVIAPSGEACSFALVRIQSEGRGIGVSAWDRADAGGEFAFLGLPDGGYTVRAAIPLGAAKGLTETACEVVEGGVKPGTLDVELSAEQNRRIFGRVDGGDGVPLSAVRVSAWRDGIVVASSYSAYAGEFVVSVPGIEPLDLEFVRGGGRESAATANRAERSETLWVREVRPGGGNSVDVVFDARD